MLDMGPHKFLLILLFFFFLETYQSRVNSSFSFRKHLVKSMLKSSLSSAKFFKKFVYLFSDMCNKKSFFLNSFSSVQSELNVCKMKEFFFFYFWINRTSSCLDVFISVGSWNCVITVVFVAAAEDVCNGRLPINSQNILMTTISTFPHSRLFASFMLHKTDIAFW